MPPDPTTLNDEEDVDLAPVPFDEASYRKLLGEQGISDALMDALVAPIKAQAADSARRAAREQSRSMAEYKSKLVEDFPYASPDLISGSTKAEMRRSAERIHKHTETLVTAAAAKAGAPAATTTAAAPNGERPLARSTEADWVAPPAGATTVVTDSRTIPPWDGQRRKALGGSLRAADARPSAANKESVLADIAEHGPRPVARPSLTQIVARGGGQPEAK